MPNQSATKADIDNVVNLIQQLGERLDQRFEAVDRRFEAVENRLDRINDTLAAVQSQMAAMTRWADAFGSGPQCCVGHSDRAAARY